MAKWFATATPNRNDARLIIRSVKHEDAPPGDGFGYHAWVEAYVGEWVMMDPSWGEDIVNPAHIALTTGDIVEQAGILYRTMGKMGIEVVEAK